MKSSLQLTLLTEQNFRLDTDEWTFNGASTRELTHCYHDYPARMIPQVAGKLLDLYGADAILLFDPYCGTGTSLVEAMVRGINAIGTDLNPLARLIAHAKTSVLDPKEIDRCLLKFHRLITTQHDSAPDIPEICGIPRLEFWFKPVVIEQLSRLRHFIDAIPDDSIRRFFQVAFSETVRESSNTRNDEFKLYRYDADKLKQFNPDVLGIMAAKLKRNRVGLEKFVSVIHNFKTAPHAHIYDFNTVLGIPAERMTPGSVDIVITSPPYGDSHTTVAYGQYSRLSAGWLGLEEPQTIDRKLMGGTVYKKRAVLPSDALNDAISTISKADHKRAVEVAAFYADLYNSIASVSQMIRQGGHACYVVGNRKVKGVVLPTDMAVRDFFEQFGFEHANSFQRAIPNKRMPLRNSPTNVTGAVDQTMAKEYIVVMRRSASKVVRERKSAKTYQVPRRNGIRKK